MKTEVLICRVRIRSGLYLPQDLTNEINKEAKGRKITSISSITEIKEMAYVTVLVEAK